LSDRKHTDKDYLFLSSMLRARASMFINEDALERMLSSGEFSESARILHELGWPNMEALDRAGVDRALSKYREELFAELVRLSPDKELVDLFRLRYDYHNAKVIIKAQAVGQDMDKLLSASGRVGLERLKNAFISGDYRFLPKELGKAMKEARDVLARTDNPQLADFVLDKACNAEMKGIAAKLDNKYINGYVSLHAQGSNLRACVRCIRMGKSEEFLRNLIFEDRYLERNLSHICSSADGISTFFATSPYREAAILGAAAAKGGRLTEFERMCDNVMVKYLKDARMHGFGPEYVLGFMAATENDITCARIILNGFLSGMSADIIKERLRDTYV